MPDATYVGAGMPCAQCGNPLTPGQPHKCGRVGNPYAPSADWKPGQDTFTAQAAGIWDEGFAAGRAAATPDPDEQVEAQIAAYHWGQVHGAAAAASPDERLREALAALPQYVITIQDREGYTYERGCAGQPMNYTGVMLADVEALVGRELKYDAPVARETTDELKDAHRPWPIAPDTVMPPRRQPVRWGSRADDPPTEIHNDPQTTKAYLAGLAAGRTEAAASPDERLREAAGALVVAAACAVCEPGPFHDNDDHLQWKLADAITATRAALAAADREKPREWTARDDEAAAAIGWAAPENDRSATPVSDDPKEKP